MKTEKDLKKEFKVFFDKHSHIKKIPFLMTIVIPKYECKGERVVNTCGELLEDDEYINTYVDATYDDIEEFWESFMNDLPQISTKDAFYLFDENTMVIVENKNNVVSFETIDYSDEIWDMY